MNENTNYKLKRLGSCILLDAIGMASHAIPVIGGITDIIWAPIAASISYNMFGSKHGKYTSVVTFIEELLPFDFVPSFTIFCILFDIIGISKDQEALDKLNVQTIKVNNQIKK